MAKKILAVVGVVLLGFVAFVATRPADFTISRKTTIAAPPATVFAQINDFHLWSAWSPWEELDPKMTRTYDGAPSGTGAIYAWKGNDDVGEGRMTITEAKPGELVVIKLEFLKPFEATNTTTFTLTAGPQTEVVWKMEGHNNFMSKAFGVFMNMDALVGKDFEKGLAKLKTAAEKAPAAAPAAEAPAPTPTPTDTAAPAKP